MSKYLTALSFCITLSLGCASETSFVQFDNNTDKTLRFVKLLPKGVDDQSIKIEVANVPIGNTTSAYSFDQLGWTDSQIQDATFTAAVKIATGTTTSATITLTWASLTGMQPDKTNFIILEGTYPNFTARVEAK